MRPARYTGRVQALFHRIPVPLVRALRVSAEMTGETQADIVIRAIFDYLVRVVAEGHRVPPPAGATLAAAQAAEVQRLIREVAPSIFATYGPESYGPPDLRAAFATTLATDPRTTNGREKDHE